MRLGHSAKRGKEEKRTVAVELAEPTWKASL